MTTSAAIRVQLRASNHTHPSPVEPQRRARFHVLGVEATVQESELVQRQVEAATAATENVGPAERRMTRPTGLLTNHLID